MRYQLKAGEDSRGIVVRPQATGGVASDGTLWDAGFEGVVETGKSFKGKTWAELVAAAEKPGYIDI